MALNSCLNPPFYHDQSLFNSPFRRHVCRLDLLGERWDLRLVFSYLHLTSFLLHSASLALAVCKLPVCPPLLVGVLSLLHSCPSVLSSLALSEQMHLFS